MERNMIQLYSINTNNYEKSISKHNLENLFKFTIINDNSKPDRYYKIFPHLIFNDPIVVYCDANLTLTDPKKLLDLVNLLKDSESSSLFFKHPDRTNARQEIVECINRRLLFPKDLEQYNSWRKEGFPDNILLTENNVIIRKINNKDLINFENIWYNEYEKGMLRDQPSSLYARWKSSYNNIIILDHNIKTQIFKWRFHGT